MPEGPAHTLGGNGYLSLLRSHCCRLLYGLCCATLHLLRALPRLVQEALYVVGSTDDLWWLRLRPLAGQYVHADVLGSVLGELGAEGLHRREPCCSCAHKVRCCLRSIGRAAQTARDGGRPLTVVRQRGSPARSSSPKRFPPPWRIRAKSSSVASAGVRKPSSGIALRGVCCRGRGLGSSLHCTKSSK